jgi:hypothetical protein
MFSGFDRVYVFGDGDAAGREFTRKVTDSILSGVGISLEMAKMSTRYMFAAGATQ